MTARQALIALLLALAAVYAAWFAADPHYLAVLLVFVLPPLACAAGAWARRRTAPFWAGVLALGWFSHAVMVAWTRPPERLPALVACVLAVAIVLASSWPGLRARFARPRP